MTGTFVDLPTFRKQKTVFPPIWQAGKIPLFYFEYGHRSSILAILQPAMLVYQIIHDHHFVRWVLNVLHFRVETALPQRSWLESKRPLKLPGRAFSPPRALRCFWVSGVF